MPRFRQLPFVCLATWALLACLNCDRKSQQRREPAKADPSTNASRLPSAPPKPVASEIASSTPPPSPHPPANTEGCPDGMVRVTGEYCPGVIQTCEKFHEEYLSKKGNGTVSERCLKYVEPSRCLSKKKQQLDFCIDRYEYPNALGELPWVLTSWRQAQNLCREQGKRLCTEDEYNFACEGPEMLPYVNGYVRDPETCNIDREYRQPNHSMQLLTYERCLESETCKAELKRLDQRHAIGSQLTCVSWAGAVDLNGNVNEWVSRPGQEPPHRSGLKGGWWGPVRNRCRPTVRFHKEFDYGYEAGFRCCKGSEPEQEDPRYDLEKHRISPEQIQARSSADRAAKPPLKSAKVERPASTSNRAKPAEPAEPAVPSDEPTLTTTPSAAAGPVPPSNPSAAPTDTSPAPENTESTTAAPATSASPPANVGDSP